MARINITDIRKELEESGWRLFSDEYKNLDSALSMECPEGHQVMLPWKKAREKLECPVCKQVRNDFQNQKVIPKTKEKRFLALDQASYDCGYAIFDGKQLIRFGVFSLSNDSEEARINKLKQWLLSMIAIWQPDYIALEGIQYQDNVAGGEKMGVTVFQTLARLQGVLIDVCYESKIPFEICPTNTWRAHCGVKGKHRADKKKSMQLIAKSWYNITPTNDEADAIGIGRYISDKVLASTVIESWE